MDDKIKIDVMELLEQTVDAKLDVMIKNELEKDDNAEYLIAIYDLLCEYGLHGRKAMEFLYKFQTLSELMGGNKDE